MLGLLLDAAVLIGVIQLLNDDPPDFLKAVFVAVAIGVGYLVCAVVLAPAVGLLFVLPMALIGPVILWLTCNLTPKQAAIAGSIVLAYKLVLSALFMSWS